MERVLFLFLRRMRGPLLMLIVSYSISITGLVLIPGQDDQGQTWHYDFFHAFYFVSFMGPTIGFGEIPYELTPAQRMWVTLSIYLTVLGWLYAIGKILTLVQEPAFARAMAEGRFIRAVRAIREPYYIVCGYGETGRLLVRSLVNRRIHCVVMESDPDRIALMQLDELAMDVPSFNGDASGTKHLKEAGLLNPLCEGIVAVTNEDAVNVKIAVTSKLLRPELMVIARAESREASNNLESFDTDYIINPFESFAEHLGMAVRMPHTHLLHRWLVALPGRHLDDDLHPPRGTWVVCGFGRFGEAVARYLSAESIEVSVIESEEQRIRDLGSLAPERIVIGSGTDPEPLHEAGVESAAGIVAGTNIDADNLSVVMTARAMNPDIFAVARQNQRDNMEIFEAAKLNLTMEPSRVIVWQILALITVPLLSEFLVQVRRQSDAWAEELVSRIRVMSRGLTPEAWCDCLDRQTAPALGELHRAGRVIRVDDLMRDPRWPDKRRNAIALLHEREGQLTLLPDAQFILAPGDRLLWLARRGFREPMYWMLHNAQQLEYVVLGQEGPSGWLARKFARHFSVG